MSADKTSISRRGLLSTATFAVAGLAAASSLAIPQPARARAPLASRQIAGVYRTRAGGFEITAVLDGFIDLNSSVFSGAPQAEIDAAILAGFVDPAKLRLGITTYILNDGERTILVDAGAAGFFGAGAGRILANLEAAGIKPEAVDVVLLTHMHLDHTGGLLTGGKAVFPNAEVVVSEADVAFWADTANAATAPEIAKPAFAYNASVVKAYPKFTRHKGTGEVVKGISALALPGHTVGHSGYIIGTGNDRLVIAGDTVFLPSVSFPRPETRIMFDSDADAALKTRKMLLDMLATDRLLMAATHLPFPTFGRVARAGTGYAFVADEWRHEL